jgi:hypothetical protein
MADERINPYETPAASGRHPATEASDAAGSKWRWRQLLLKSIIYLRAFAVFNSIMVVRGAVVWVSGVWESLWSEGIEPWQVPPLSLGLWVAVTLLYFASAAFFVYACYLLWALARELRVFAGRHHSDPTPLANLHLRFWQASLISTVLSLANDVTSYVYDRYLAGATWPVE